MCVAAPVAALISVVSSMAAGAMSLNSSYQQAKKQNKINDYTAKVQENNAKATAQQADYARLQASRKAREADRQTAWRIGQQRAKAGSSGALVDTGSFLDVNMSTAEQGAYDSLGILQQGDMDVWQMNLQAANMAGQAKLTRSQNTDLGMLGAEKAVEGIGMLSNGAQKVSSLFA